MCEKDEGLGISIKGMPTSNGLYKKSICESFFYDIDHPNKEYADYEVIVIDAVERFYYEVWKLDEASMCKHLLKKGAVTTKQSSKHKKYAQSQ